MSKLKGLKIILNGTSEEKDIKSQGKGLIKLSRQFGIQGPSVRWDRQFESLTSKMNEYSGKYKDYFKSLIGEAESIRRNAQCYNPERHVNEPTEI